MSEDKNKKDLHETTYFDKSELEKIDNKAKKKESFFKRLFKGSKKGK